MNTMKKVESTLVISHSCRVNLIGLQPLVGVIPQQIEQVAKEQGFEISGKQIWAYDGCDGNPETPFDLKICLPIKSSNKTLNHNTFQIETLDAMEVKTAIHKGDWSEIGAIYCTLMNELASNNLRPTGKTREIYDVVDFQNPNNCITEVQVEYI